MPTGAQPCAEHLCQLVLRTAARAEPHRMVREQEVDDHRDMVEELR